MKSRKTKRVILGIACVIIFAGMIGGAVYFFKQSEKVEQPDELLLRYTSYIEKQEYGKMYAMLDHESAANISQDDFITRNQNIYEGINFQDPDVKILGTEKSEEKRMTVNYHMEFESIAGKISFEHQAVFSRDKEKGYLLVWDDSMIFPELTSSDKVRVSTVEAKRGKISDRNGRMLAGQGTASSVGLVPGKMSETAAADIEKLAQLLDTPAQNIQKRLEASWVKEDSFVPIKMIPKNASQDELLAIPGVMISDVEAREYPLGEKASQLTGYLQNVTAEDLEEHKGEGYEANSVIGRNGMESLYEKELKGRNGYEIVIADAQGNTKSIVASVPKEDGQDITLTIDAQLQEIVYDQFGQDKSCSVAMNPYTGEILALVSTPSFNSNDFIMGISDSQWTSLNEDERKPLLNRFRQSWAPGSIFKPVTAAIGLTTGAVNPEEDYGNVGLSWQKDKSWGAYHVTTLHAYEPVILENALIYSDNIYFAKAALKIGAEPFMENLDKLGFNQTLPFEITMAQSQYSNSDKIETEIQLADSGYGQGEILVNPLHLACIYTSFVNNGDMIKPYLLLKETPQPQVWIPQAFPSDASERIRTALEKAVNSPNGTGYAAHRDDVILAGKTGTAEIKASKDDTTGTEIGWFGVFTTDEESSTPILLLSMVEDVKDRGGSGYVVQKDKAVLDAYLSGAAE